MGWEGAWMKVLELVGRSGDFACGRSAQPSLIGVGNLFDGGFDRLDDDVGRGDDPGCRA